MLKYLIWQQIKNEAKTIGKHIHVIVNAISIVQPTIQVKIEITKHVNVSVKTIVNAKKIILGILAHVFVRIVSI